MKQWRTLNVFEAYGTKNEKQIYAIDESLEVGKWAKLLKS